MSVSATARSRPVADAKASHMASTAHDEAAAAASAKVRAAKRSHSSKPRHHFPHPPPVVQLREKLGAGAHANVVSGTYNGKEVAIKILGATDPHAHAEVAALEALGTGHSNVVSCLPPVYSPDHKSIYVPMELCDRNLLTHADTLHGIEESDAALLFGHAAAGLRFMHARGVYHLDIKPENILLRDGVAKMADFGTAVISDPGSKRGHITKRACGTIAYAPPEDIRILHSKSIPTDSISKEATSARTGAGPEEVDCNPAMPDGPSPRRADGERDAEKGDVWSLGVTIFVCVTGFFPWTEANASSRHYVAWADWFEHNSVAKSAELDGSQLRAVFRAVFGKASTEHGTPLSPNFVRLMQGMLHPDPTKRMSMAAVSSHPFFKEAPAVGTAAPRRRV